MKRDNETSGRFRVMTRTHVSTNLQPADRWSVLQLVTKIKTLIWWSVSMMTSDWCKWSHSLLFKDFHLNKSLLRHFRSQNEDTTAATCRIMIITNWVRYVSITQQWLVYQRGWAELMQQTRVWGSRLFVSAHWRNTGNTDWNSRWLNSANPTC